MPQKQAPHRLTDADRAQRMLHDLGGLSPDVVDLVRPLVIEAVWTEQRLADARRFIGTTEIVVPYDNGGGQMGVRRNPAYDGYNALAKTYVAYLKQIQAMCGVQVSRDEDATSPLARQRRESPLAR